MQLTYLFYDIETTGLNKCFDQIIQFAAIRTDQALNEITRYEYRIRLNADVIPDPEAILTHGCGIEELMIGDNELEVIKNIHQIMNIPGTISIGYNTLNFDDEFLRFSFYRNLLPPYTHQYANQCSRMDLYPITLLYYLFKPEIITWPSIDGKTSLKLEKINEVNQFISGTSHQAIVDVEITLALARRFFQCSEMWQYAINCFNKKLDQEKMQQLTDAILVYGSLGAKVNYLAPVYFIGQHYHYKNQYLWLRLDHPALQTTTIESIANTTYVFHKKAGENLLLLPPLSRFQSRLQPEQFQIYESNKAWMAANIELLQQIRDYHLNYQYPKTPNLDIDAALYETAFPTPHEESLFQRFHQAASQDKLKIASSFPSTHRQKQALRIMGRHYPDHLATEEKGYFDNYLSVILESQNNQSIVDFKGNAKRTAKTVIEQINSLMKNIIPNSTQQRLLENLKLYLQKRLV